MKNVITFLLTFQMLFCAAGLKISGNAKFSGTHFSTPNGGGFAESNEKIHVRPNGLTISATVRLNRRKKITGSGYDEQKRIIYQHDIIASKGGEFVFGRRSDNWCDQLYINFKDGNSWAVPLSITVKTPNYNQWAVWSVTLLPVIEPEQGVRKTLITLYINGEAKYTTTVNNVPDMDDTPIRWGNGCGINGDIWDIHGDIAEMQIIGKALNDDEVHRLAAKSKLVKIDLTGVIPPSPELAKILEKSEKAAQLPLTKFLVDSIRRASANGFEQTRLSSVLENNFAAVNAADNIQCLDLWQKDSDIKLLASGRMVLLIAEGKNSGPSPILGIFDLDSQRGIFGKNPLSWQIKGNLKNRKHTIKSIGKWQNTATSTDSWETCWESIDGISVSLKIKLLKNRLEMAADFINKNPDFQVTMFDFPVVQLKEMKQGKSYLVHPFMSGILHFDPVKNPYLGRPDFWYPSGAMSMQFGAYCDDASGVYLSPEDPDAGMKQYVITGRNHALELCWSSPVPFAPGKKGGNAPEKSNSAVIELIPGNWFDAAMTYKRFAMKKGSWTKPKFRPTPKWYLENMLWILHFTHNGTPAIEATPAMMKKIQNYFQLPTAIHWYHWYNSAKAGWPHYIAYENVKRANQQMHKDGVRVKAYIDTKLWSELDGPGFKSDWQFSSHGKPAAVIDERGKFLYERYRKECRDVVMCPYYQPWQDKILEVTQRTADEDFDAVYHDQVGASYPRQCFSAAHGHTPNHPEFWQQGYSKMFEKISKLQEKYPSLAHDTEDAADAHLRFFDGFLSWRWTDNNQIPLFSAVYGGLTQFTGRTFGHHEKESFFVKTATQLLYGEQFGWFMAERLYQQRKRASYVKQMMHLRNHLLNYFNGGQMCRQMDFTIPPKSQTTQWGDSRGRYENVTMPEILHAVWQNRQNGKRVIILVNTSSSSAGATAILPDGKFFSCRRNGRITPVTGKEYAINLEPMEIELLMDDENDAAKAAAALQKFAGFTEQEFFRSFGYLAPEKDSPAIENFDGEPNGVLCIAGDNEKKLWKKVPAAFEPDKTYILKVKFKRDPATQGSLAVFNYSSRSKVRCYASASAPADGKWHTVTLKFKTDKDVFNSSVFFYNEKSGGNVYADDLEITEYHEDNSK
ncbi:MAG: LamG domain-containing protein [Lentisphaerae bacterium]|nr:LamG domain-containing protein [Lentisphaerota bacterium]